MSLGFWNNAKAASGFIFLVGLCILFALPAVYGMKDISTLICVIAGGAYALSRFMVHKIGDREDIQAVRNEVQAKESLPDDLHTDSAYHDD